VLRPIPVVTTFHDLRYPYLFPKAGGLRDKIVMRLANASNGVISTNHEDAARLAAHPCSALIPIGSNIPVQRGIDTAAVRVQAGASPNDFLIVYFGLVNHSKGLDTLLEAVAQLADLPMRLALVGAVAGSSDPTNTAYMSEIDALIERLGISDKIFRTGYVDDAAVSGYLAAADVVALPFADGASYRRGTLMAAIQHGCAIVTTTPQVAIPAFIDGENLRHVPPNDPPALASALRQLHAAPDARVNLRHGAKALAQHFEWGEIAQQTTALYRVVIGTSR
jgi:glycosyltransferase involved in cell wall biosynthesis